MISIIAAVAKNGVIGSKNGLPWHIPEDLKHYKEITTGHTMIMGRKTFESIMKSLGKPLPNRKNVVITRDLGYKVPQGVLVYTSIEDALEATKDDGEIFINGGGEIYRQTFKLADKLYLTELDDNKEGDVKFPDFDRERWNEISREKKDGFYWVVYEK
ncbi:MAG TPA: dihydrofolate reductase [Patescibacteria group bacterium]|nr:dihydrofolate reductase [Patescibacteria group bacterium]